MTYEQLRQLCIIFRLNSLCSKENLKQQLINLNFNKTRIGPNMNRKNKYFVNCLPLKSQTTNSCHNSHPHSYYTDSSLTNCDGFQQPEKKIIFSGQSKCEKCGNICSITQYINAFL